MRSMEIVKRGFTASEFEAYVKSEVAPKMNSGFTPVGVVLHNTFMPTLAGWPGVVNGKTISVEQRLENTKAGYVKKGWSAGPHLFIDAERIWTFTPLWQRGIHSPSFNHEYWGIELPGNFDVEAFPAAMRTLAESAIKTLYGALRKHPDSTNFHFHKEDPRTTHKNCPGKNVGTKEEWLKRLNAAANAAKPAQPPPPNANTAPKASAPSKAPAAPVISESSVALVERWEAFRAKPYRDGARMAIGYGRNEGHRGFVITEGMTCTPEQAAAWLREDLTEIAVAITAALRVQASPTELGAMCSLAYNIGTANFLASSVLRNFNAGDRMEAAASFLKWCKRRDPKTGELVKLDGLLRRRQAEADLFLNGDGPRPAAG